MNIRIFLVYSLIFFRETYVIFSGGMPYDQAIRTPCITVVYSKTTTVLEMEHNVIDFITLCDSPYPSGKPCIYFNVFIFLKITNGVATFSYQFQNYKNPMQ